MRLARELQAKPRKPDWLLNPRSDYELTRNTVRGYDYWSKLYDATPWWACYYAKEIARIYRECPFGCEVDHIVPLNHPHVQGLHVPWNLQYLPKKANQFKSNNDWPDSWHETKKMFDQQPAPHQTRLAI